MIFVLFELSFFTFSASPIPSPLLTLKPVRIIISNGVYQSSNVGEIFATQFFSARKLKFILFLRASDVSGGALEHWQQLADTFKGSALFAYMVDKAVPDVVDYFAVDISTDSPLIVAHDPSQDFKYKSKRLKNPADATAQQEFVAGVLTGAVRKVLKSEPVPKQVGKVVKPVKQAVGSNVIALVSQVDKDVLLEVYSPNCAHCKRLRPTYDILGRAVQGDNRIVIAKIDGTANDLPASWGVKGYPALLWFPAKDKPYKEGKDGSPLPTPRPYWDAGHSLHELVSFVQRQSSFDPKSLKVATSEQLGTLMGDEDTLKQQYELEDRWARRNEGRDLLSNPIFDWLAGEVAFDGKRWHIAAAGASVLLAIVSFIYSLLKKGPPVSITTTSGSKKKSH
jgi:thiol-disulfide isomerase/thioredoxin